MRYKILYQRECSRWLSHKHRLALHNGFRRDELKSVREKEVS